MLSILTNAEPDVRSGVHGRPLWAVAILSSREDASVLRATIDSVLAAVAGHVATVDVLVNGNERLAGRIVNSLETHPPQPATATTVRVWCLSLRDKANAWNQYVHGVWPGADITFFVDGYAAVKQDSLTRLHDGLQSSSRALGAAAVPTSGRSATALRQQLLREPQINGSLYALRIGTMERLRREGFYMPIGLYRLDGLLGSALALGLAPADCVWTPDHIVVVPEATWLRGAESPWSPHDVLAYCRRAARQALGVLEARAIKEELVLQKSPPRSLPRTSAALIDTWVRNHWAEALLIMVRSPLAVLALARLHQRNDWARGKHAPRLVCVVGHANEMTAAGIVP